jgi:hypothetical protein
VRDAAAWIAATLPGLAGARGRKIDRVCIDADGAVCAWVSSPVAQPEIVRAEAKRQTEAERVDDQADDGIEGYEAPPRFPDLPGELDFQPLMAEAGPVAKAGKERSPAKVRGKKAASGAPIGGPSARRVAVLASPDASARLLLDELDRVGIDFGSVVSIWHAMASVWDPGLRDKQQAGPPRVDDDGVVIAERSVSMTAVVVLDPASQRLLWSWSRAGSLDATGSIRLVRGAGDRVMLTPGCVGRLTAEWLSWAAQLGLTPERVLCVGPFRAEPVVSEAPALPGEDDDGEASAPRGPAGFDAGAFAGAVAKSWPRASVDVVTLDDPVEHTLTRFAERVDAARDAAAAGAPRCATEIEPLTDRPGRLHRWMYRSVAAATVCLAVLTAAAGWRLGASSAAARAGAIELREAQKALLAEIDPALSKSRNPTGDLRRMLEQLGPVSAEPAFDPPKPILQELESIALAIGDPAYTLDSISLQDFTVRLVVDVDGAVDFENLQASLQSIARSTRPAGPPTLNDRNGRLRVTFNFLWQ